MKYLRMVVLVLAVAAVSLGALPAFSQQEIDPDHFDQPIASRPAAKPASRKTSARNVRHGKTQASHVVKRHNSHPAA
jgi:hypothetical protein